MGCRAGGVGGCSGPPRHVRSRPIRLAAWFANGATAGTTDKASDGSAQISALIAIRVGITYRAPRRLRLLPGFPMERSPERPDKAARWSHQISLTNAPPVVTSLTEHHVAGSAGWAVSTVAIAERRAKSPMEALQIKSSVP